MSSRATHTRPLALVTGASKRIGRATAIALAESGCDVIVTFRTSQGDAQETVDRCVAAGADRASCGALELDLSTEASIDTFLHTFVRDRGRLDVLVHNASGYDRSPLGQITSESAMAAQMVNAIGPLLVTQGLVPLLNSSVLAHGAGVVGMCDIHAMGEHGLPRSRDYVAYAMSKSAHAEMIRSLARELAPRIRVNGVAPGVAAWPKQGEETDPGLQAAYLKRVPLARSGTPEECARVVCWLALEATYLTGEIIRFDGGRNMT